MKKSASQTPLLALGVIVTVILIIFVIVEWSRPRVGTVVIPGGTTYLGPTPK